MFSHRACPNDCDEVRRRLPEVDALRGDVRDEVIRIFMYDVPAYFWIARASKSYHPPDERACGGLWLHTKRVFTAYRVLERSFRAMSDISSYEANCARAAVLLHDGFTYGIQPMVGGDDEHPYAKGYLDHLPAYGESDHDVQMARHIREHTSLPDEVANAVESHGGSADWLSHEGPSPRTPIQRLVHFADLFASNPEYQLPVLTPITELEALCGHELDSVSDDYVDGLDDF